MRETAITDGYVHGQGRLTRIDAAPVRGVPADEPAACAIPPGRVAGSLRSWDAQAVEQRWHRGCCSIESQVLVYGSGEPGHVMEVTNAGRSERLDSRVASSRAQRTRRTRLRVGNEDGLARTGRDGPARATLLGRPGAPSTMSVDTAGVSDDDATATVLDSGVEAGLRGAAAGQAGRGNPVRSGRMATVRQPRHADPAQHSRPARAADRDLWPYIVISRYSSRFGAIGMDRAR